MQTHVLSPTWSRIVHRLHLLGEVETSYANDLSTLTERGNYQRFITSAQEQHSRSIDGTTVWNFLNWHRGWIENESLNQPQGATIKFQSSKHALFHQLRILDNKPNDCLNCLIQLFSSPKSVELTKPQSHAPKPPRSTMELAYLLEKVLSQSSSTKRLHVSMLTQGGLIQRSLHATNLYLRNNCVELKCAHDSSLKFSSSAVSHIQSTPVSGGVQTTIYNHQNNPLTILRRCA